MKPTFRQKAATLLFALSLALPLAPIVAALLAPSSALAQTVTKSPQFVPPNQNPGGGWLDIGNGPTEIVGIEGNGSVYTASGSGLGSTSGSSTTLTLTGTPAVAPCVGCIISGTGITSGTTVAAFNGTTTITLSAAMTVAASTPLSWGAACPAANTIPGPTNLQLSSPMNIRGGTAVQGFPMYTQGRVCVHSGQQNGFTFVNFPIGAW